MKKWALLLLALLASSGFAAPKLYTVTITFSPKLTMYALPIGANSKSYGLKEKPPFIWKLPAGKYTLAYGICGRGENDYDTTDIEFTVTGNKILAIKLKTYKDLAKPMSGEGSVLFDQIAIKTQANIIDCPANQAQRNVLCAETYLPTALIRSTLSFVKQIKQIDAWQNNFATFQGTKGLYNIILVDNSKDSQPNLVIFQEFIQ